MLRPMRNVMAAVAAAALLLAPAGLSGQQQPAPQPTPQPAPQPMPQPEIPAEVREWIDEIEQIQTRLAPVQQEALQDADIRAQQEALSAEVEAAMEEVDPGLSELGPRMEELEREAQAAQQAGEMERLQGLAVEANQIQQRVRTAQLQVLEQPEMAAKVEAFQENLQAKMIETDPEAEELLDRFEELASRIEAAMTDPGPGA